MALTIQREMAGHKRVALVAAYFGMIWPAISA